MMYRKRWTNLLRATMVSLVGAAGLHGAGLQYLAQNATAIVVGSVATRVEGPTQVSFSISIGRVLAGTMSGTSINVVHTWTGLVRGAPRSIDQPLLGIWFLVEQPSGTWDVLTARPAWVRTILGLFLPGTSVAPGGQYAYGPQTSVPDALVYEVASAIQATNGDPSTLLAAIDGMDTPVVRSVLQIYSSSADPGFRAIGLAGSLERDVAGSIAAFVQLWQGVSSDPHSDSVVAALRDSWRDSTPTSVATLASFALASPTGTAVRSAAIRALAAIHTLDAVPSLGALLSSNDAGEQERAVYGLSAFANGCPIQTSGDVVSMGYLQCTQPSAYRTPDTLAHFAFRPGPSAQQVSLVAFWQAWWSSHPELH